MSELAERSLEQRLKDHRESAIRLMAILMCRAACIEPVDQDDGSPHWWIFAKEAENIIDDIQRRFPPPTEILRLELAERESKK